jgi:hypothetical protein
VFTPERSLNTVFSDNADLFKIGFNAANRKITYNFHAARIVTRNIGARRNATPLHA